ncbi:MAG TPA: translation initiation factor IF-2 [Candidatus Nanopusillus sp.]|nr:translation initiation factor IF-2 [Candidatus Nanopusillus sp.]HIP90310.1 translation initiation factor IF-2 [Candidatus Nanopusillus sp.]
MVSIRSPIIVILGHVDSGKTSLLDRIRKTSVAAKEAGGITQHIGATEIPIEVVKEIAKPLLYLFKFDLKIPGLLFIDTPGHEVFTNLRKRGGSVADLAIIVVDIIEGFQPQTYEAIEICKQFKVPFVIALNKIDRIPGWSPRENSPFLESIKHQNQKALQILEEKLYIVVGQLYELGFEAERFDRIQDFRKQVSIIPVSAKTGEGIPELLLIVAGLVQRFLEEKLKINVEGSGRGIVLERKEAKGFGTVIDVILYDGKIRKGDTIAFLTKNGIKTTKVRILLKPNPLQEIRDRKTRFYEVDEVSAAAGIRIVADGIENALPGSPIYVVKDNLEEIERSIKSEIGEFLFETDKIGVVVKADTLGTLEAIVRILKEKGIPIAKADIGNIDKEDIMKALSVREKDHVYGVILGFNVNIEKTVEDLVKSTKIKVILDNVIYRLVEKIEQYIEEMRVKKSRAVLESLTPPGKILILPGYIFRRSNPAIVGVEVLAGRVRPGTYLMREDGKVVGKVKAMQSESKSLNEARRGDKVAISIDGAIVGRHLEENDILYTYIDESEFKKYKQHKEILTEDEKEVLREIARIMRRKNPTWGV